MMIDSKKARAAHSDQSGRDNVYCMANEMTLTQHGQVYEKKKMKRKFKREYVRLNICILFSFHLIKNRFLPLYYTVVTFLLFLFEGKGVISCCKREKQTVSRQQQQN